MTAENKTTSNAFSAERSDEMREKLATGQMTIAEFAGLSSDQLYEIARQGYRFLNSGKLEEARDIYAGLAAADPYNSVFHCHLGAVLWRMGETEKAFEEYEVSLRYNLANVDALAGRGELYILKGETKKGLEDLRKALENDPTGNKSSTIRARALLLALRQAANQNELS